MRWHNDTTGLPPLRSATLRGVYSISIPDFGVHRLFLSGPKRTLLRLHPDWVGTRKKNNASGYDTNPTFYRVIHKNIARRAG
jgi:hypothetical protein